MKKSSAFLSLFIICLLIGQVSLSRGGTLPLEEVVSVLKENLPGVPEADLRSLAASGLVDKLKPRVILVTNAPAGNDPKELVSKTGLFDQNCGYLRIGKVASGLDEKVAAEIQKLAKEKKLRGLLIDLRFSGGLDYAAAAATADKFLAVKMPLIDWGEGSAESSEKKNAILLPLVILVNSQTRGAAEGLAAILRESASAVLVGNKTAGEAVMAKEFKLSTGDRLLISRGAIKIKNQELAGEGLEPDVVVAVSQEKERGFFENPYAESPSKSTGTSSSLNSAGRPKRQNEAELVRQHREGFDGEELAASRGSRPAPPLLSDTVLVRAIDLLKGISVLHPSRAD